MESFATLLHNDEKCLGEVWISPVRPDLTLHPLFHESVRISSFSPRCKVLPQVVLHAICEDGVWFKMSPNPNNQTDVSDLLTLHDFCSSNAKTAVVMLQEGKEMHLLAMNSSDPAGSTHPAFWAYSVPQGMFSSALHLLSSRSLSLVFDLDETLFVANTLRSFEDKMEALEKRVRAEADEKRRATMTAELLRYKSDRELLVQYYENDQVVENGAILVAENEVASPVSPGAMPVMRPIIRLRHQNIVLTRIDPEIRDTSVLVRTRPAWEELRKYIVSKQRKRFEVFICTMSEREYAQEMWRLLDPKYTLIPSIQLCRRIVCVKSDSKKSLSGVFKDNDNYSKMAIIIDDRVKVWEDDDQNKIHMVPPYLPYYAPNAESTVSQQVLSNVKNVVCYVRGEYYKEIDDMYTNDLSNLSFESPTDNLPLSSDISHFLQLLQGSKEQSFILNEAEIHDGIAGDETKQVFQQQKQSEHSDSQNNKPVPDEDTKSLEETDSLYSLMSKQAANDEAVSTEDQSMQHSILSNGHFQNLGDSTGQIITHDTSENTLQNITEHNAENLPTFTGNAPNNSQTSISDLPSSLKNIFGQIKLNSFQQELLQKNISVFQQFLESKDKADSSLKPSRRIPNTNFTLPEHFNLNASAKVSNFHDKENGLTTAIDDEVDDKYEVRKDVINTNGNQYSISNDRYYNSSRIRDTVDGEKQSDEAEEGELPEEKLEFHDEEIGGRESEGQKENWEEAQVQEDDFATEIKNIDFENQKIEFIKKGLGAFPKQVNEFVPRSMDQKDKVFEPVRHLEPDIRIERNEEKESAEDIERRRLLILQHGLDRNQNNPPLSPGYNSPPPQFSLHLPPPHPLLFPRSTISPRPFITGKEIPVKETFPIPGKIRIGKIIKSIKQPEMLTDRISPLSTPSTAVPPSISSLPSVKETIVSKTLESDILKNFKIINHVDSQSAVGAPASMPRTSHGHSLDDGGSRIISSDSVSLETLISATRLFRHMEDIKSKRPEQIASLPPQGILHQASMSSKDKIEFVQPERVSSEAGEVYISKVKLNGVVIGEAVEREKKKSRFTASQNAMEFIREIGSKSERPPVRQMDSAPPKSQIRMNLPESSFEHPAPDLKYSYPGKQDPFNFSTRGMENPRFNLEPDLMARNRDVQLRRFLDRDPRLSQSNPRFAVQYEDISSRSTMGFESHEPASSLNYSAIGSDQGHDMDTSADMETLKDMCASEGLPFVLKESTSKEKSSFGKFEVFFYARVEISGKLVALAKSTSRMLALDQAAQEALQTMFFKNLKRPNEIEALGDVMNKRMR